MKNLIPRSALIIVLSLTLIANTAGQVVQPTSALEHAAPVNQNPRRGVRGTNRKLVRLPKKSGKRVITMWWVIFNKPSACTDGDGVDYLCGLSDLMSANAGDNASRVAIMHAAGGVATKNSGFLRLTSTLYKTQCELDLENEDGHYLWGGLPGIYSEQGYSDGFCPEEGENAEVHLILHDKGKPSWRGSSLLVQLSRFMDPLCKMNGGPRDCESVGATRFTASGNGTLSNPFYRFPLYPEGCVESGACTEVQNDLQISGGDWEPYHI